MPERVYNTNTSNLELRGGSLNLNKPANNSLLISAEMRDNFFGLDMAAQDLRYRVFSNNAVGKSTFYQNVKQDYPREFVWVNPPNTPKTLLGSPLLTGWITPRKVGNTIVAHVNLFGQFDENISFIVTRANYSFNFNPLVNPNAAKWYADAAYMNALQAVHPSLPAGRPYHHLPQAQALCTARVSALNGTEGQIVSFQVQDTVTAANTGWAYTVWAKASAGTGGRETTLSGKQGFVLNSTDPVGGVADKEYGISTIQLTELWVAEE